MGTAAATTEAEAEAETSTASGSRSSDKETGETGETSPDTCGAYTTTETSETTSANTPLELPSPVLRPPAETGTRPKTSVVSPGPAESTNTGSVLTDDQEEVRKRR